LSAKVELGRVDYQTGKLQDVARRYHPSQRREYAYFWLLLIATSVPYAVAFYFRPLATGSVVLFMAYFQVLATIARSSGTSTSHYIRLLLSGSNPIGMTGGSSLLFGAVDAIFDFNEDSAERRSKPFLFWSQIAFKLVMTPIGGVLLIAEFAWDLLMLRHPRLFPIKWRELFSLAEYHDVICPEKSNDIFYADLAISRYLNDPFLYQWNRMRALVFELKQYSVDIERGYGVAETNLFHQSDIAAYQTLKRLRVEEIESAIGKHYETHRDEFPFPASIGALLIKNARPIHHYLTMKSSRTSPQLGSVIQDLGEFIREHFDSDQPAWKVLRLLDSEPPFTPSLSGYIRQQDLNEMADSGILARDGDFEFRFTDAFCEAFSRWLTTHYEEATEQQASEASLAKIPDFFVYLGKTYIRTATTGTKSPIL